MVPDDEGVLTEVTIPAGSEPISAQDGHAVSLAAETIYRTSLDGETISTEFTAPESAEGAAEAFWTIGTDALVLAWAAPIGPRCRGHRPGDRGNDHRRRDGAASQSVGRDHL